MSDSEEEPPPEEEEEKEGEGGEGKGEDDESESLSRSIMDYLMPAKDMVAKMTCRRKFVIISEQPEPDYLDELEENLVLYADALEEEIYHFSLQGNLQRDRITRFLQKSTKQMEFPYIFVNGEWFDSFERFQKFVEQDTLHSKVHGTGRGWDIQTGSIGFALNSIGTHWEDGMSALRRSAEKRGMVEPDTRTEKQKQKEKRKKAAKKAKERKQKEKEAKKERLKSKLVWKARKKMVRFQLARIGINLPVEDKKAKAKRRKKKKEEKNAKAKATKLKKLEKENADKEKSDAKK